MAQASKPIVPTQDMTLPQRKRAGQRFMEQVIRKLNPLIKGTGWKRRSAWVFRTEGDWYLTAFITGRTTPPDSMANVLKLELGIKPMAVDPIYWRALGLHENLKQPLSFRSNATFKVAALPMATREWNEGLTTVEDAAQTLVDALMDMAQDVLRKVSSEAFSGIVQKHEARERYLALKLVSLIAEGQGDIAMDEIKEHYLGEERTPLGHAKMLETIDGFQRVVDGTDAPQKRRLSIDVRGMPT